jgi:hypothetical protein
MTQTNCGTCKYWTKEPHSRANWGECGKVNFKDSDQACLLERSPLTKSTLTLAVTNPTQVVLYTRDVFFCAEFQYQPPQARYTVVDAAREAARSLKEKTQ